jgi:nucleoside-diphosphate-sugar epimerase
MKLLLTGASSFTGLWFAESLAGARDGYEGVRRQRVERLAKVAEIVPGCPFGSDGFIELLRTRPVDVLCHHAAMVTDYKSPNFDVVAALKNNTLNLPAVLRARELQAVVLTGSVFEANEGVGSEPLRAFSPYGLSKGLTAESFRYWCSVLGVTLAKFVIPNPFGPWEEPRFCAYLMRCWAKGETANVQTPDYVRDNIHASLLAASYADLVGRSGSLPPYARLGPSGYVETQGAFARRFADEIGRRLGIATPLHLGKQTDFSEPLVRHNTDSPALDWNEARAWDELAAYYRISLGIA